MPKVARLHYAGPMTLCDVISLPLVTISFVTIFFFDCGSTSVKTHKKFPELNYHTDVVRGGCLSFIALPISCALLPINTEHGFWNLIRNCSGINASILMSFLKLNSMQREVY